MFERFKSHLGFSQWSAMTLEWWIRSVNKMLNDLTPRSNSNWRPTLDADAMNPNTHLFEAKSILHSTHAHSTSMGRENVLMRCEKWHKKCSIRIETRCVGMRSTRNVLSVSTPQMCCHTVEFIIIWRNGWSDFDLSIVHCGDNEKRRQTHRDTDAAITKHSIHPTICLTWARERCNELSLGSDSLWLFYSRLHFHLKLEWAAQNERRIQLRFFESINFECPQGSLAAMCCTQIHQITFCRWLPALIIWTYVPTNILQLKHKSWNTAYASSKKRRKRNLSIPTWIHQPLPFAAALPNVYLILLKIHMIYEWINYAIGSLQGTWQWPF